MTEGRRFKIVRLVRIILIIKFLNITKFRACPETSGLMRMQHLGATIFFFNELKGKEQVKNGKFFYRHSLASSSSIFNFVDTIKSGKKSLKSSQQITINAIFNMNQCKLKIFKFHKITRRKQIKLIRIKLFLFLAFYPTHT